MIDLFISLIALVIAFCVISLELILRFAFIIAIFLIVLLLLNIGGIV